MSKYVFEKDGKIVTFEELKKKAKEKKDKAVSWCKENEVLILSMAPFAITGITRIISASIKNNTAKQNRMLKENYVWDNQNGCYYELKHKLNNQNHLEISRRRADGESIGDILDDMRLLK